MAGNRKLNVVDEMGNIIGEDTRENIHNKGLLHRQVHVWIFTPKGEIIFQHRAKDKDTNPDLLDTSVAGHVEIGSDYETDAIKEISEETGISADKNQLKYVETIRSNRFDPKTGTTNNVIKKFYTYRFDGKVSDLRIEKIEAVGFEAWPIESILNISEKDKERFTASIFDERVLDIFRQIQKNI